VVGRRPPAGGTAVRTSFAAEGGKVAAGGAGGTTLVSTGGYTVAAGCLGTVLGVGGELFLDDVLEQQQEQLHVQF